MVKKARYTEIGDVLSAETAFIQASNALDVAASIAEENRDAEGLLRVAQTYIAIAERLMPHPPDDDDDDECLTPDFGFQPSVVNGRVVEEQIIPSEVEEEADEPDEIDVQD